MPDEMDFVMRAFLCTVQLAQGSAQDTRRRAWLEEAVPVGMTRDKAKSVLYEFVSKRLLVMGAETGPDGIATREWIELPHEALIQHWDRLRGWVDRHREDVRFHRRLFEAATHWDDENRPNGLLWRPPDLDRLDDFNRRANAIMTVRDTAFFQASRRVHRRGHAIRIATATTAVAACFLFLLVLGMIRSHALSDLQTQQSRALAAASRQSAESGAAMQGMLLALEALPRDLKHPDRPYVREAEVALQYALSENREQQLIGADMVHKATDPPTSEHLPRTGRTFATYSPDGKRLLATTAEGRNTVWDTAAGRERLVLEGRTPSSWPPSTPPTTLSWPW